MIKGKLNDKYCDYNNFKRARYFHGMLLTERDFREEQIYHNEKRKLLNRMLHGWGVVCGLGIKVTSPESSKIIITPGLALDCHGNEILVCEDFEVDLKKEPELCPDISKKDPCAEMERDKECKYYVAIKYNEITTDPVQVYTPGGGCEEKACDYSRTREGFCVGLFKSPPCYAVLPEKGLIEELSECFQVNCTPQEWLVCVKNAFESFHDSFCKQPYPCPICCCEGEPYVVLGSIDLEKTKCRVTAISPDMIAINDERRYVRTPMFWQYYLASFHSSLAEFLDNPFKEVCEVLSGVLKVFEGVDPGMGATAMMNPKMMLYMSKVVGQSEGDAKKTLEAEKLKYSHTVTFSADKVVDIIGRIMATKSIEPGATVDLVTDKKGKALFFVPAPEVPKEEVEFRKKVSEMEKTVADYRKRLEELEKKIKKT